MNKNDVFLNIINHKINVNILYQDNFVTAFCDINPKTPVHILIVTNIKIPTVNDVQLKHEKILGRLFTVASLLARKNKIDSTGYRLIVNCNTYALQEIYHLHMHLLGGIHLGPIISNMK